MNASNQVQLHAKDRQTNRKKHIYRQFKEETKRRHAQNGGSNQQKLTDKQSSKNFFKKQEDKI